VVLLRCAGKDRALAPNLPFGDFYCQRAMNMEAMNFDFRAEWPGAKSQRQMP
jgi:hypothetical protein